MSVMLAHLPMLSDAGRFEWVDGALTRAIEEGRWVLLDNANLCNPTVLDRLNPLLEPDGMLMLNECGMLDGEPRILRPHPDFRLFLTMDPRCTQSGHLCGHLCSLNCRYAISSEHHHIALCYAGGIAPMFRGPFS